MTNPVALRAFVEGMWDEEILPTLTEYIRIPNKSPDFDAHWREAGHMEAAVRLYEAWAKKAVGGIRKAKVEVVRLENRTPVILIDIPGEGGETVLLYGHLDKQPEMTGWRDGLSPWTPVREGERLYGRGGADDGYAMFAALTAVLGLEAEEVPHARCLILIEACEESGSADLPAYVAHLKAKIGRPSLVVCLDSGCGDYDRLWTTTSLRGLVGGALEVEVLAEGMHSGAASGIVPSSFRIVRSLLSRVEDAATGVVADPAFQAQIPPLRREEAARTAAALGETVWSEFPLVEGMTPTVEDPTQLILNRTWRPQLSVTGARGLPDIADAGNVLRPSTTLKLSLRLPPTADADAAAARLKAILESNPPYGAKVSFHPDTAAFGWNAPAPAKWLTTSLEGASRAAFGAPPAMVGEGGTIPFMAMLGRAFPDAQFVITGVLGPHANAHGPNEFLHIGMAKRLTVAVAMVLADHFREGTA